MVELAYWSVNVLVRDLEDGKLVTEREGLLLAEGGRMSRG